MKHIFESNFYTKYQSPNADELIEKIDTYTEEHIDNDHFTWGEQSSSDKIPLKSEDYIDLLMPSIDLFCKELNIKFTFNMDDPWINLYKRGDHQEIHDHYPYQLSCNFVANDGEDFSKFYFIDRHSYGLPYNVTQIIDYNPNHILKLKAGDIIFFPSYLMHGVSPHKSDIIRKTLSFNFNIEDLYKQ